MQQLGQGHPGHVQDIALSRINWYNLVQLILSAVLHMGPNGHVGHVGHVAHVDRL